MTTKEHTLRPTLRLEPPIPPADETTATIEAEDHSHIHFDRETDQYHVEYPIPTRRLTGFKALLEERCPAVEPLVEIEQDVAEATVRAAVPDAVSAFAILESIYTALGKCRVCGDEECVRGYIFTDETVMHRDTAEEVLDPPHSQ